MLSIKSSRISKVFWIGLPIFGILLLGCGCVLKPTPPPTLPEITSTITRRPTATPTPTSSIQPCTTETIPPDIMPVSEALDPSQLFLSSYGTRGDMYQRDIYVFSLDGTIARNITNNPYRNRSPFWSPDGKKIAFLSDRNYPSGCMTGDCPVNLFVTDPYGSTLTQLSDEYSIDAAWSTQDDWIAYTGFYPSPYETPEPNGNIVYLSNIHIVSPDGSERRNLTTDFQPGYYGHPMWSSDGKRLAFMGDVLYIYDIENSKYSTFEYPFHSISYFIWLPNNKFFYISNDTEGLYLWDPDAATIHTLTIDHQPDSGPMAFSPDGEWFAYRYHYYSPQDDIRCEQIRIANIATQQDYFVYDTDEVNTLNSIFDSPLYDAGIGILSIEWVNGGQLFFTQFIRYETILWDYEKIFKINLDGTGLQLLFGEDPVLFDGEFSIPYFQP